MADPSLLLGTSEIEDEDIDVGIIIITQLLTSSLRVALDVALIKPMFHSSFRDAALPEESQRSPASSAPHSNQTQGEFNCNTHSSTRGFEIALVPLLSWKVGSWNGNHLCVSDIPLAQHRSVGL
ncbi:unnamed protein product [Pleuronectes platessa]|uniref:Uncharacterized protein n=1 Tax=Pleuronectes platessa TaxID=8262 RepID=A0A9N7W0Q6_PLEPL|nr:unnamed protein product [Pleuronectes platessa]